MGIKIDNNKKLKKVRIFMKTINRTRYEYIESIITNLKADEIYNSFFEWMSENIKENKNEVIEKDLKYLKQPYEEEELEILLRLEKGDNWLKLVRFNTKSTEDFKGIVNDMKDIHNYFNEEELENKGYKHYNRLLSWYTATPKNIDKIINNTIDLQINKEKGNYERVFFIDDLKLTV